MCGLGGDTRIRTAMGKSLIRGLACPGEKRLSIALGTDPKLKAQRANRDGETKDSEKEIVRQKHFARKECVAREGPTRGKDMPRDDEHLTMVAIGASAGGIEAASELLKNLPADTGLSFVLVQHLDPNHHSMLTELLSKQTSMGVSEVMNGMAIERNHFYVIPPNASIDGRRQNTTTARARRVAGRTDADRQFHAVGGGRVSRAIDRSSAVGFGLGRHAGNHGNSGAGRGDVRARRRHGEVQQHAAQRGEFRGDRLRSAAETDRARTGADCPAAHARRGQSPPKQRCQRRTEQR